MSLCHPVVRCIPYPNRYCIFVYTIFVYIIFYVSFLIYHILCIIYVVATFLVSFCVSVFGDKHRL